MKWKNTHIDKPPEGGQPVLISVNGVYYVAVYDTEAQVYRLVDEPKTSFNTKSSLIYWTEFTNPK